MKKYVTSAKIITSIVLALVSAILLLISVYLVTDPAWGMIIGGLAGLGVAGAIIILIMIPIFEWRLDKMYERYD